MACSMLTAYRACQRGTGGGTGSYQGNKGVEQGPLQGEEDGCAGRENLDEGGLEQLVAIERYIPEEPSQGASKETVPVVVP